ncbi:hypothetical protein BUALT_Bualt11G0104200 [Buddleja alternifolia]|uniref:NAC domain-containing protein n=1 Tax=Buddleja alternifolia TaxID=168488 RepID=A0AAV6WYS4_9LAMI|nr:hypothetical protein BUALT_Bualt11G0104200 [Buddleja alternifolia]
MDSKNLVNNDQNPFYHYQEQTPYNTISGSFDIIPATKLEEMIEPECSSSANKYPVGFRFRPTDEELINYLKEKIMNKPIRVDQEINIANIYQYNPQELAEMFGSSGDNVWYFFTPRDRKYPNGIRPNRAAGTGYWKATGGDKHIRNNHNQIIGSRKALVFYEGKPSKDSRNDKTNWLMQEYTVGQSSRRKTDAKDMRLDDWVLCKIYLKATKSNKKQSEINPVDQQYDSISMQNVVMISTTNNDHYDQVLDSWALGDNLEPCNLDDICNFSFPEYNGGRIT